MASDDGRVVTGETLPGDHPLSEYSGTLDDHADHVEAIGEYLEGADPQNIRSLMLVVTVEDQQATETIPTMRPDADFQDCVWYQLAAHISHVAAAFEASPEEVAKHAVHVLRDQRQGGEADAE